MPDKRIEPLDGLRGAAALIVVIHHSMFVTPTLWDRVVNKPAANWFEWMLVFTPLRIVWAGGEAVWIFFILSGFVLVRPYLHGRSLSLRHYYPRRFLRLYLPFFGSFALALMLRAIRSRPTADQSGWVVLHQLPTTTGDAFRTLFLFAGDSTTLNSVWWSLRWEVWFSLLLPLVILFARRWRNQGLLLFVVCVALSASSSEVVVHSSLFGFDHNNPFLYLPMFGIGVALALSEDPVRDWLAHRRASTHWLLVAVAISMMTSTEAIIAVLKHFGFDDPGAWVISGPIGIAGAGGLVALAMSGRGFSRLLGRRPVVLVGVRSYTLYLIHEPLVVTLAIAFGMTTMTWWWIPFMVLTALVVTEIMYRLVERPTLTLIRRIPAGRSSEAPVDAAR